MPRDLAELKEALLRAGATVSTSERAHILEVVTSFGARTPLYVRWLAGRRAVHFTQPLEITISDPEQLGRAAMAVARLNQFMPTPALVLDLDAGWIDYRARLFADRDGELDFALCEQMVMTIVGHVERLVPVLDEWLRGEDADLALLDARASATLPWLNYSE